jgi:glycosyltransferase involved in cell wall biosynthesis
MKNIHLLKSSLTIVFLFFFHITVLAQINTAKITFINEVHDFGTIEEASGTAQYTFKFVNSGTDSIKLNSVRASCGCTTPYWEKNALMPGDTGKIEVAYNPLNRPGKFAKTVTVRTSGEPETKILRISGYVEPKPKTIEDEFNTELGGIRLKSKFINFGNITTEKPVSKLIEVYNQTEDTITVLDRFVSADFIKVTKLPAIIPPKKSAEIDVNYLPKIKNDLGFMNDPLTIFTDEVENSNKALNVIATINEYFPPMSEEELANAPHIVFETQEYDFGHINEGEKMTHNFKFTNTGRKTLNIRKTKTTCGCTVSELPKMDYAPNESGEISITYDSEGRRGTQIKRITLFTNDPTAPTQDLIIKAYVRD